MITRKELIKKYIDFFKDREHTEIKNYSLVPENDPTVLFTTAGMHPLVPYLLGEPHPKGKRLVNVQRCIRTGDIEEVGDPTHHTMFEMLGNWSLGDYFKKEAINFTFEFLTNVLKIPKENIAVSCFKGDNDAPKDEESKKYWMDLGINEKRIVFLDKKDNWWGPAGKTGPCGPDTEIFVWTNKKEPAPEKFDPENKNWVEIGNNVLMQYFKDKENYIEAKQKNIDFGGGLERLLAILNNCDDNYMTEIWQPIIKKIQELSKESYKGNEKNMRIIADHIKASVFIIADEVTPSNSEQGYVLRRLIRRAVNYGKQLGLENFVIEVAKPVFETFEDYKHLMKNKNKILEELEKEEKNFLKTLEKGIKVFEKLSVNKKKIDGKDGFLLFQSYGFPLEMIKELANEKEIEVDINGFNKEMKKHQELSRTASAGKFKSGLADDSDSVKKLHTATHLLNEALKIVLNKKDIHQKGSNITAERLRFDFNFERKLTEQEIKKIEELINKKIKQDLPIRFEIMPIEKAKKIGAQGVFEDKYEDEVKVYLIGEKGKEFSKEICAGPHVENTSEIGKFKIIKEESSSAGVRRIKARIE